MTHGCRHERRRTQFEMTTTGTANQLDDGHAHVRSPAPLKMLVRKFGFTPDVVSAIARERVAAVRRNESGGTR
jgi:hypothetical protein